MKAHNDNSDPWTPNSQAAQLPSYSEAVGASAPYPTAGHLPPHPTQQPPYPTAGPPHHIPYPTHQPPYPTQVPHPTPQIYAEQFTDFPQPATQYQTQYQSDTTPVIHHPATHIQTVVTSSPHSNACFSIVSV
uniref:Uncharacterized protein n=1 Tax=Fopius arisanus TaxID=64838 RepID=A0A0C9QMI1_9HYME